MLMKYFFKNPYEKDYDICLFANPSEQNLNYDHNI